MFLPYQGTGVGNVRSSLLSSVSASANTDLVFQVALHTARVLVFGLVDHLCTFSSCSVSLTGQGLQACIQCSRSGRT